MGASWTPRKPWKVVRKKLDHFFMKIFIVNYHIVQKKISEGVFECEKTYFF